MGTNYYFVRIEPTVYEPVHIGKSSYGWKFLFHAYGYWETPYNVELRSFDQWKQFLIDYTADKSMVIMDEYNQVVDVDTFLSIVEFHQRSHNPNDFKYAHNIHGYRFTEGDFC